MNLKKQNSSNFFSRDGRELKKRAMFAKTRKLNRYNEIETILNIIQKHNSDYYSYLLRFLNYQSAHFDVHLLYV